MSWAEIKKAVNSDLSTPLNEYMQKYLISRGEVKIAVTACPVSTSSLSTLLSITGRGLLLEMCMIWADMGNASNKCNKIQLETAVDSTKYVDATFSENNFSTGCIYSGVLYDGYRKFIQATNSVYNSSTNSPLAQYVFSYPSITNIQTSPQLYQNRFACLSHMYFHASSYGDFPETGNRYMSGNTSPDFIGKMIYDPILFENNVTIKAYQNGTKTSSSNCNCWAIYIPLE